ncbi:MAG: hypothetical protein F6K35_47905 [Okeania sp. SIO2H7]|nr:hypothetical protein [Okeania sp. SIO2H7]
MLTKTKFPSTNRQQLRTKFDAATLGCNCCINSKLAIVWETKKKNRVRFWVGWF